MEINGLTVERAHTVAGINPGTSPTERCGSFVTKTDVYYPTDTIVLWNAMRCMVWERVGAATEHCIGDQCR